MKISIIITNYNYSKFLARSIRSALDQNYPKTDYDIVVIDDCSNDNSRRIIDAFGNKIHTVCLKKNKGLSAARNIGIDVTGYEYITFLDADDCLHPDFLNVTRLYHEFGNCDAYASDYFIIDDEDNHLQKLNVDEFPLACGIVYQTKHLRKLGGFDELLRIGEDIEFRNKFFKNSYSIGRIEMPLYRYRLHQNNMTKDLQGSVIKEAISNGKRPDRIIPSSITS